MMAIFARMKRVTDPLGEEAKARLCGDRRCYLMNGYASSGCEHEALASLTHDFFFENDDEDDRCANVAGLDDENYNSEVGDHRRATQPQAADEAIRNLVFAWSEVDVRPFRSLLLSDITEASETVGALRSTPSAFRRAVMVRLKEEGYNAGLCKVNWEKSVKLTAGSYEYIDVLAAEEGQRYIVDLGFAAEFEVARPTAEYQRVLSALPAVLVAQPEEVRQVVKIAAEAARRSLKARGLHVPPWRKGRYMNARWLGPYRRTVNAAPAADAAGLAPAPAVCGGGGKAVCRAVGFVAASTAGVGWPATLIK